MNEDNYTIHIDVLFLGNQTLGERGFSSANCDVFTVAGVNY